ncbi:MAG: hypothetical protein IKX40_12580 [Thermoguttaceae bacterium]|nr:hypothetical protein [Thermoguttaceae bacterium]
MENKDNANSENEYVEADYTEFIAAPHTEVLVESKPVRKILNYIIFTILGLITLGVFIYVFQGIHKEILQQNTPEPLVSHKKQLIDQVEEPSAAALQNEKTNTEDKSSRRLIGHKKLVNAVCFSPDGKYMISGEGDIHYDGSSDDSNPLQAEKQYLRKNIYYLFVWNYQLGKPERMLDEHHSPISAVTFSTDGLRAASADITGNFVIWDANTWTVIDKFSPETRTSKGLEKVLSINSLAFSPDGTVLAAGGSVQPHQNSVGEKNSVHRKGCVILWDMNLHQEVTQNNSDVTLQPKYDFTTDVDCVFSLAYTKLGKHLIVGASGANSGIYVLERNGNISLALDMTTKRSSLSSDGAQYSSGHNTPPSAYLKATLRFDNRRVAAGDNYGRVSLWEFQGELSGQERIQAMDFSSPQDRLDKNIRDIKYSFDGKYLVTCGEEIAIWNGESDSLQLIGYLSPQVEAIYQARLYYGHCIAFTPDGESVAVACSDKIIRIWDFKQFSTMLRRITPVERAEKGKNFNTRFDAQTIETPAELDFRTPKKKNPL